MRTVHDDNGREIRIENQGRSDMSCPVGHCEDPSFLWTVEGLRHGYIEACVGHAGDVAGDALQDTPGDGDDRGDEEESDCTHEWVYTGTAYGGDDERYHGEGRCYCSKCGADGDA